MDAAQALVICRMVKAACPSQAIDEYTPNAWAAMLDDVRFDDARAAVVELGKLDLEPGHSRYIEPGHIRRRVKLIRARRTEAFDIASINPPPGLTGEQYVSWKRDVLRRAGDGQTADQIAAGSPDVRRAISPAERAALTLTTPNA